MKSIIKYGYAQTGGSSVDKNIKKIPTIMFENFIMEIKY